MFAIRRLRATTGITLVEATIIVSVSALLAGMAGAALRTSLTHARDTRARHDANAVAMSFSLFAGHVSAEATKRTGGATIDLLVGAGEAPALGAGGDGRWTATSETDSVGSLDNHIVTNAIGYPSGPARQVNTNRGWHGPYVEAGIGADPWGRRYAINLSAQGTRFVLSAGPNGLVETHFEGRAIAPGGDDIIALVWPGQ